jgi:dipeptidyl-peptidase-4
VTGPSVPDQSFPRRFARTRRFTLGQPRSFRVSADGSQVTFLRSGSGTDPVNALWSFDVDSAEEQVLADPTTLLVGGEERLPPAELARRERARESASGVVSYAADPELRLATFSLGGLLFVVDVATGDVRRPSELDGAFDPRPDPTLRRVAFVVEGSLRVVDLGGGGDEVLAGEEGPDVTWGVAEFVAAEEMDRSRGYWWAPDGEAILAARVDTSGVEEWHINDPAHPARPPARIRYPPAGTPNADVSLHLLRLGGGQVEVGWDREVFPYLVTVDWSAGHPPILMVQSRDQRTMRVLTADPSTGATTTIREVRDDAWLDIVVGVPRWLRDGRLVSTADLEDTRRLVFDDDPVTPRGLQVRRVVDVGDDAVLFTASEEPTEVHLWRVSSEGELHRVTSQPGVHDGAAGGRTVVTVSSTVDRSGSVARVLRDGNEVATIRSNAETPGITPRISIARTPSRDLRYVVLFPDEDPGGPLPVLMDPYGGPQSQRVVAARDAFLQSQWFADQGFAVVVADGRGTPGRGSAWDRAVRGDLASAPLEDQVEALHAAAEAHPGRFDLDRVAIRGWSFGGYLAALAVLRRPDVFHAAVAGAPVTDWRLYDTHYTERYLGQPDENPDAYRASSVLDDAAKLERPLLLIHGLADDNVVVANTLQLSAALTAAGRPHSVLPLPGVTHMTPQEVVAENLLLLQVGFLRQALKLEG